MKKRHLKLILQRRDLYQHHLHIKSFHQLLLLFIIIYYYYYYYYLILLFYYFH